MDNSQAFEQHLQAIKYLAVAMGEAKTDAEAKWLRRTIGRVRQELYEMVVNGLENNSGTYTVISDRLKKGSSDLKRVRDRIEQIQVSADKAARLISWATKFLAFL